MVSLRISNSFLTSMMKIFRKKTIDRVMLYLDLDQSDCLNWTGNSFWDELSCCQCYPLITGRILSFFRPKLSNKLSENEYAFSIWITLPCALELRTWILCERLNFFSSRWVEILYESWLTKNYEHQVLLSPQKTN